MASSNAYTDIKAALTTALSPTPVLDFDAVDPEQHQGDVTWCALEEDPAQEELISLGDPTSICNREEGEITIHVFARAEDGLAEARTVADLARKSLRWQKLGTGTQVLNCDPPVPGFMNQGRWTSAEVSLLYQHDTFEDIS